MKLPYYKGNVIPNCDYSHGELSPAIGTKQYCVSRANRADPMLGDTTKNTYCHAPDIAFYEGKYYIQYLSNPQSEHTDNGICVLASSQDGKSEWDYTVSFPEYKIPRCELVTASGQTHRFSGEEYAFCHHRTCFYYAKNGVMLLSSFYGYVEHHWETPWDEKGIGRVVRRLFPDGHLGEIYFILPCYQAGWTDTLLKYPLFSDSADEEFVAACNALLSDRLYTQQWAEENGDQSDYITIKHAKDKKYQAFCCYHIGKNKVVALWKHSFAAVSTDGGKTFSPPKRSPSLIMSGQKVWAEKTADAKYAMVYVPTLETQHRWPLAVTTSKDGIAYDKMLLVHGEAPPMRYQGSFKDIGPQYMRGIWESLPAAPDKQLHLTYSVNKEDIWTAVLPVPIEGEEKSKVHTDFSNPDALERYNLYQPKLAEVVQTQQGLSLRETEPLDSLRLSRVIREKAAGEISVCLTPKEIYEGIYLELKDPKGKAAVQLILKPDGGLYVRTVTQIKVCEFAWEKPLKLTVAYDCALSRYTLLADGKEISPKGGFIFKAAVSSVNRFELRCKAEHSQMQLDVDPEGKPEQTLPQWEAPCPPTSLILESFYAD